jgi:integrase
MRNNLGPPAPAEVFSTAGTLLSTGLADGEPVKTVSERLGHSSAVVTMTVYAHALPGDQKRAASRFAALVGEV